MIAFPAIGGGILGLAMFFAWLAKPAAVALEVEVGDAEQLALSEAPFIVKSRPASRDPVRRDDELSE
jgi:hypothetical protein